MNIDADFQPTERSKFAGPVAPVAELPLPVGPWASVDPTNRAFDRTDRILDALEKITEQAPCGCWVGASCCVACR